MLEFLSERFLLENDTAAELYHEYAELMPIFDYHSHLSPAHIAENLRFRNLAHMWLEGDHYKWRLMRANGIRERYCTGSARDREKFSAWVKTVPYTIGNPIYHWCHMELKKPFGIEGILIKPETEDEIWQTCNDRIGTEDFRVHGLLKQMKVDVVCTTDDPADTLEHHTAISRSGKCPARVYPTFRPDKLMMPNCGEAYAEYLTRLAETASADIASFDDLLTVIDARHAFFHEHGCRLSDHALENLRIRETNPTELEKIFQKKRNGRETTPEEEAGFSTALLRAFAEMDARRGWTMQLHLQALRDVNSRQFSELGSDTGFDAIRDGEVAVPAARFLDSLERKERLPKTILYSLDSRVYNLLSALAGCFHGAGIFEKIQIGPAWWFNDHRDGITCHLKAVANTGLLSRFVGMLTDSRSFLSFSRHEYFRRILCNVMGQWIEKGEAPRDIPFTGGIIQDICYNNAVRYFRLGDNSV